MLGNWFAPKSAQRALAFLIAGILANGSFAADPPKPEPKKFPAWDEVVKGADRLEGLFPMYYKRKDQQLYLEIQAPQYEKEYLLPISIARGAGTMYLGGDTLNFGNQWIVSFRRVADRILLVRRNVIFKAKPGSPQADAVKVSYNDSVIAAVPVRTEEAGGNKVLIDLADLFFSDLGDLGVSIDRSRSSWAKVKAFPQNLEIEVNAVFSLNRGRFFFFFDDSIPDPRGAQVVIHFGLSPLVEDGYTPRVADDRVGHFLAVLKDFSTDNQRTAFSRYVTRWKLEKSDPTAEKSPPKEPIVFWIEKTVPREYRPYVKAGILEWNKAFEKVGFIEAIQARDQQAADEFDPEDVRYNTFRWITTSAGFAMGPSRANPKTGQILDADIVFDESMVRFWRYDYLNMVGSRAAMNLLARGERQAWLKLYAAEIPFLIDHEPALTRFLNQARGEPAGPADNAQGREWRRERVGRDGCLLGPGMSRQLNLLYAVLRAEGKVPANGKVPEEYIGQAIKEVVMHEVGHTLGLRHNFKASTMLSLADCNNPEITRARGLSGSVMDYNPANFAPRGQKQGEYFSTTIGPYDYWAIEYAYKPIAGNEHAELAKIASRIAEPGHDYGTDEDAFGNPDPRINLFDLGDPLDYARQRTELAQAYLKDMTDRVVADGEGWQRARDSFSTLLGEISQAAYLASQYIGGEYSHRDHKGDPNARTPFAAIPLAKQREAIAFVREKVLADTAFQFTPDLLRRLAPEQWDHWGMFAPVGQPYHVYGRVLSIQRIVLYRFLDPSILRQIQESELHATPGEEPLRLPEIFDGLTATIFSELPTADDGKLAEKTVAISTIRRNLQREYVHRLCQMVVGRGRGPSSFMDSVFSSSQAPPPDAKSLARLHVKQIGERIKLSQKAKLDGYSKAHLDELLEQVQKTLAAQMQLSDP